MLLPPYTARHRPCAGQGVEHRSGADNRARGRLAGGVRDNGPRTWWRGAQRGSLPTLSSLLPQRRFCVAASGFLACRRPGNPAQGRGSAGFSDADCRVRVCGPSRPRAAAFQGGRMPQSPPGTMRTALRIWPRPSTVPEDDAIRPLVRRPSPSPSRRRPWVDTTAE